MSSDARARGWIVLRQSSELMARIVLTCTDRMEAWTERRRQRRALLELNDHLLKDIGIGRGEAYREGSKPFWRS